MLDITISMVEERLRSFEESVSHSMDENTPRHNQRFVKEC